MGSPLFDLFVIAEDFFEIAFDIIFEPRDGDDPQTPARFEPGIGVVHHQAQQFIADFGGQVGDDGIETGAGGYVTEGVAQVGPAIAQPITLGVACSVVDGNKILVDHVHFALRAHMAKRQAEWTITAAQIEAPVGRFGCETIDQQARAGVDAFGIEEAPSRVKNKCAFFEGLREDEILPQSV